MSCGTCGIQASDTLQGDTGVPAGAPSTRPRCPYCQAFVSTEGAPCTNPQCPGPASPSTPGPAAGSKRRQLETQLATQKERGDPAAVPTLLRLGLLASTEHDLAAAIRYYEQASAGQQGAGEYIAAAHTQLALSEVYFQQGDLAQAEAACDRASGIHHTHGQRGDEVFLLLQFHFSRLGTTYLEAGRRAQRSQSWAEAEQLYQRAALLAIQGGDTASLMAVEVAWGACLQDQGRYREAYSHMDTSLALARGGGHQSAAATALLHLGRLASAQDDPPTAADCLLQSRALYTALKDATGVEYVDAALSALVRQTRQHGFTAVGAGDFAQAKSRFQQTAPVLRRPTSAADEPALTAHTAHLAALDLLVAGGDTARQQAVDMLGESVTVAVEQQDLDGAATSIHLLAMLAEQQEDFREGRRLRNEASRYYQQAGDTVTAQELMVIQPDQLPVLDLSAPELNLDEQDAMDNGSGAYESGQDPHEQAALRWRGWVEDAVTRGGWPVGDYPMPAWFEDAFVMGWGDEE